MPPVDPPPAPLSEQDRALVRAGTAWTEVLRRAAAASTTSPDGPIPSALQGWRREVDPGDLGAFDRRLRLGGLDHARAIDAACGAPGLLDADPPAHWWPWYAALRADVSDDGTTGSDLAWLADREAPLPADTALGTPFSALLWPAVNAAWARLADREPELVGTLDGTAARDLRRALLARLSQLATPSLADALDADLPYGARLLRRLGPVPADPPRDRYAAFCRAQARERLGTVADRWPVLPSLLGTAVRQWHATTVELLERVRRDREDLAATFGLDPGQPVTGITTGAGDTHHDGRSVAVLEFGELRLVYKPRDVRLEALWAACVAVLDRELPDDGLRAPRILDRVDDERSARYGYAEYIDHVPAVDADERARFYVNAGRTMALLLALSATDGHYENLIAHHDQLVLVDGEALFETALDQRLPDGDPLEAREVAAATVLQLGMLPTWLWLEGRREGYDITALGTRPPESGTVTVQALRAVNTDAMSRGSVDHPAPHPTSLPTPPGEIPDLAAHVDDLVAGFAEAYRAIVAVRDTDLARLLDGAGALRRRLIARATYVYASLLQSSCQPEALGSPADRGMVLERLTRAYLLPDEERLWPMLGAEQAALARLDVPLFEADLAGGRTTWPGGELLGWPDRDALADVRARLAGWGEEDLARQLLLIRASIRARAFRKSRPSVDAPEPPAPGTARDARTTAEACHQRLRADALAGPQGTSWLTLALLPDGERVTVQPVGPGLYDGRLGIAAFLFAAGDPGLARAAADPVLDRPDPADPARTRRMLVSGGLGLAGAGGLLRAVQAWADRGNVDAARAGTVASAVVRALSDELVARDTRLDLIGGAAGLVAPLVALRDRAGLDVEDRARLDGLLRTAADLLVDRQLPGGGWRTLPASAPLTGLAHGASGIALALAEAAVALDASGYLDAALRGLAYEAGTFEPDAGNWPDLREATTGGFMLGWCAGAPGIALARERLLALLPDHEQADRWREELAVAATTTAQAPLLAHDHLCCGNLGRVAILRTVGRSAGEPAWCEAADRIAGAVLAREAGTLPRSMLGTQADDLAVPGLMTGLAGAGLALLDDDPSEWVATLLR